ncbi:hypothetical protein [Desulfobacter curvatus]|uniref:hypothetical protein n=1 Tax=Desulfobacter curvatus TaxID=2290 RepID=UPI00036BA91D|nr:hypothetical protein [Desulfobacter curvatus]
MDNEVPAVISAKIKKLRENLPQFSQTYDFPGSHRTSNMVDRLMQRMDRHLFSTKYFHGTMKAANLSTCLDSYPKFCASQSMDGKAKRLCEFF